MFFKFNTVVKPNPKSSLALRTQNLNIQEYDLPLQFYLSIKLE